MSDRKTRLQDTGLVEYHNGIRQESRYFINIAGLGYDAAVVRKTNRQKEKGRRGEALYFINLLSSLLQYKVTRTEITVDEQRFSGEVFTISIGIGRFSGGGMMQTPGAIPDDGLFDVTLVKKIGKVDIILSLKKLYDGSILEHKKIQGFQGKLIRIESDPPMHLEADGESLGHSPMLFRIIPRSIQVVCGQSESEYTAYKGNG
jgi:diacylglycerol kinase family enzyme